MRRVRPFVLAASALSGCGGRPSTTEPSPARMLAGQAMAPCPVGPFTGLCGTLSVPEDRSQPSGRQVALRVALLPATGTPQPDPLFMLAGGPGGAAAPPGVVPANDAEPVRSSVPILLLVGEADPQDPPDNVVDSGRTMPESLTVVVPGHGHGVAHRGCLPDVIAAFLEAGTTRGLDTSCATSGGVPVPAFFYE